MLENITLILLIVFSLVLLCGSFRWWIIQREIDTLERELKVIGKIKQIHEEIWKIFLKGIENPEERDVYASQIKKKVEKSKQLSERNCVGEELNSLIQRQIHYYKGLVAFLSGDLEG